MSFFFEDTFPGDLGPAEKLRCPKRPIRLTFERTLELLGAKRERADKRSPEPGTESLAQCRLRESDRK